MIEAYYFVAVLRRTIELGDERFGAMGQELAPADGKNRQQPSPNLDLYLVLRAAK